MLHVLPGFVYISRILISYKQNDHILPWCFSHSQLRDCFVGWWLQDYSLYLGMQNEAWSVLTILQRSCGGDLPWDSGLAFKCSVQLQCSPVNHFVSHHLFPRSVPASLGCLEDQIYLFQMSTFVHHSSYSSWFILSWRWLRGMRKAVLGLAGTRAPASMLTPTGSSHTWQGPEHWWGRGGENGWNKHL